MAHHVVGVHHLAFDVVDGKTLSGGDVFAAPETEARQRARYAQLMVIRQGLMARQQRGRFFKSKVNRAAETVFLLFCLCRIHI